MSSKQVINRMDVMRSYSSAFSRSAITDIIKYGDYSQLGWLYSEFGSKKDDVTSYGDYLKALYLEMVKNYRCEYVFKNELVGYIIKHYKKNNTVTYNELRVGKSIVDIAVFKDDVRRAVSGLNVRRGAKNIALKSVVDRQQRLSILETFQIFQQRRFLPSRHANSAVLEKVLFDNGKPFSAKLFLSFI